MGGRLGKERTGSQMNDLNFAFVNFIKAKNVAFSGMRVGNDFVRGSGARAKGFLKKMNGVGIAEPFWVSQWD
jgi:hypothetical protein